MTCSVPRSPSVNPGTLEVAGGQREMPCWPSAGDKMRDVARRRWLVQAKTRDWIMTKKTSAEAGGRRPGGNHCLSAFSVVVVSCPEVFPERQQAYSSVPPQCHQNLIPLPAPPSSHLLSCRPAPQCTPWSHQRCEWEHGAGTVSQQGHEEESLRGIAAHEGKGRKARQF